MPLADIDQRHVIETVTFDLDFASEEEAYAQQAHLDRFVKQRLVAVIEKVFNEFSTPDHVLSIDALEIDIGRVAYRGYEEEIENRLEEELRFALKRKRASQLETQAAVAEVKTRERVERELLVYFLCNGHFPWNAQVVRKDTLDQMLQSVVSTDAQFLVTFLKNLPQRQTVIERLVNQFSDESLTTIAASINDSPLLRTLLSDLRTHVTKISSKRGKVGKRRNVLWIGTILTLMKLHGGANKAEVLVEELLKELTKMFGVSYVETLTALSIESTAVENPTQLAARLSRVYHDLLEKEQRVSPDARIVSRGGQERSKSKIIKLSTRTETESTDLEASSQAAAPEVDKHARACLEEAIRSGRVDGVRPAWRELCRSYAPLVVEMLRTHGCEAKVRRLLCGGFPKDMLKEIVGLLSPVGNDSITALIDNAELFRRCFNEADAESDFKRTLWRFTLTHLLVECGSQFKELDYFASVLRQIAAYTNTSTQTVLHTCWTSLETNQGSARIKNSLRVLIVELNDRIRNKDEKVRNVAQQSAALVRAYDGYTLLRQRLTDMGSNDAVVGNLDELARGHAGLLLRVFRELQTGALPLSATLARLSGRELYRLTETYLATLHFTQPEEPSEFVHAVERYAARATDAKRYYSRVLECLVNASFIDFEAIVNEASERRNGLGLDTHNSRESYPTIKDIGVSGRRSEPTRESLHDRGRQQDIEGRDAPLSHAPDSSGAVGHGTITRVLIDRTLENLARYLRAEGPLNAKEAAALIYMITGALTQQPHRLRRMLTVALEDRSAVEKLTKLLPERILTRILYLLRDHEHYRAQICADTLALACYAKEIDIDDAAVQHLKWAFIFIYAVEEGRPFDERQFTLRFVGYLAKHTPSKNVGRLKSFLVQQLSLNRHPSNAVMTRRIIAVLSGADASIHALKTKASDDEGAAVVAKKGWARKQAIYINNAGLVLCSPYLPQFFTKLSLTGNVIFKNAAAVRRGVQLLQFIACERSDAVEYQLVLNKILCGLNVGLPIERKISINDDEKETIESLLQGMIEHWKSLGKTSINGLRESFLQREGKLQQHDNAWHLTVETKAFDMLLDQLPWGFTPIKHPWMDRVLYVDWR